MHPGDFLVNIIYIYIHIDFKPMLLVHYHVAFIYNTVRLLSAAEMIFLLEKLLPKLSENRRPTLKCVEEEEKAAKKKTPYQMNIERVEGK